MSAIKMDAEHSNTLVSEFLKRLSRSTLTPFAKADLVDLATHLGWSKTEKVPKKAELRGIVESLAVSARLQECYRNVTVCFHRQGSESIFCPWVS